MGARSLCMELGNTNLVVLYLCLDDAGQMLLQKLTAFRCFEVLRVLSLGTLSCSLAFRRLEVLPLGTLSCSLFTLNGIMIIKTGQSVVVIVLFCIPSVLLHRPLGGRCQMFFCISR